MLAVWDADFAAILEVWRSIIGRVPPAPSVETWESSFTQLAAEQRRLVSAGLWVSGPADLMSVARVADDELIHSNVVAWLLSPAGRHGLGDSLLVDLMAAGWPDRPRVDSDAAVVEREVSRGDRRADIIVTMGAATLVLENKVWSDESEGRCEDLFRLWNDPDADVRFLLLSRDGHPPRQTRSREAAEAWRSLSYASLGGWLSGRRLALPGSLAQQSVEQYAATIQRVCRRLEPFRVAIGGGKVDD
jgi:hypothetical protein